MRRKIVRAKSLVQKKIPATKKKKKFQNDMPEESMWHMVKKKKQQSKFNSHRTQVQCNMRVCLWQKPLVFPGFRI